jgi:predicted secreted protein
MVIGKESVERSKKVIFVSYCTLCQSVRAKGVAIKFPAVANPVISFLMDNDISIIQMPCPELRYQGVKRDGVRKEAYDNAEFRAICKEYAEQVTHTMRTLRDDGFRITGVLGIENSPTCGVNFVLREGKGRVHESGVFIEELQNLLLRENVKDIAFVGISVFNIKKSLSDLRDLISKQTCLVDFSY